MPKSRLVVLCFAFSQAAPTSFAVPTARWGPYDRVDYSKTSEQYPFTTRNKFAAFDDFNTIDPTKSTNVEITNGVAELPPEVEEEPLLTLKKPWEFKVDNGYPTVIKTEDKKYRLYYDAFVTSKRLDASSPYNDCVGLLYAESEDGVSGWRQEVSDEDALKAQLLTVDKLPRKARERVGGSSSTTNILRLQGHGVGVIYDEKEPDPNRRYKAFGALKHVFKTGSNKMERVEDGNCADKGRGGGKTYMLGGLMTSKDGLEWKKEDERILWNDGEALRNKKQESNRWDAHHNLFSDVWREDRLVVVTRGKGGLRSIALSEGRRKDLQMLYTGEKSY